MSLPRITVRRGLNTCALARCLWMIGLVDEVTVVVVPQKPLTDAVIVLLPPSKLYISRTYKCVA